MMMNDISNVAASVWVMKIMKLIFLPLSTLS